MLPHAAVRHGRGAALAVAFACLAAGCSKSAPTGFGPGLGSHDGDETTGILTTGIEPTGGGEVEGSSQPEPSGSSSSSSNATSDPSDASDEADGSSSSSPATTGSVDASSSGIADDPPGDPLDPSLDVPEDGEACETPGSLVECPGIAVCRFATTEQGLCESCDECGNLGALCSEGTDCDILFSCYEGRCTNFCQLGTFECGPVEDCLDVGHPTYGVCDPSAL